MKATKFLPLALLAMMLTPAAFAATASSQTSNYSITVPEFLDIRKTDVEIASSATFDDDYTVITLSPQMQTTYTVLTNVNGKKIYLKGTCPIADGTAPAIGGTGASPKIAFTNISCTTKPAATAVSNAIGSGAAYASNGNVIAFALAPTITPDGESGATAPTIGDITNGAIPYTLHNGKYTMDYKIGTSAVAQTFSLHDENGTYQATLTMSDTTP